MGNAQWHCAIKTWTERHRTDGSRGELPPATAGENTHTNVPRHLQRRSPSLSPRDATSRLSLRAQPMPISEPFILFGGFVTRSAGTGARCGHHVRPGAMAGSLILVPFYACVLSLMLCGSVADSRAVFFRELYEPAVPEEYGVDDGPQTFTMQDHFNYLRERELARRRGGDSMQLGTQSDTLEVTSHVEEVEEDQPIFVSDYCHTGANTKYGP